MADEEENTNVPIPRTLEAPPRTTGDAQQDLPLLIDWFYRAYQVITQSVTYINAQVDSGDVTVANLPDPNSTTLASAQQTANDAYILADSVKSDLEDTDEALEALDERVTDINSIYGTFDISETDIGIELTFTEEQPDTDYRVIVQPVSNSGSPANNAFILKEKTYATDKFTAIMLAAPGAGNTITYEWQLIREYQDFRYG